MRAQRHFSFWVTRISPYISIRPGVFGAFSESAPLMQNAALSEKAPKIPDLTEVYRKALVNMKTMVTLCCITLQERCAYLVLWQSPCARIKADYSHISE